MPARPLHRAPLMRKNLFVLITMFGIGMAGCGGDVDSGARQQASIAPPMDLAIPRGHLPGHPPPGDTTPPPPLPFPGCFGPGCHGPNNPTPEKPRCAACHYIPGLPPPLPPPIDPDVAAAL
jgi:hypothetical protein